MQTFQQFKHKRFLHNLNSHLRIVLDLHLIHDTMLSLGKQLLHLIVHDCEPQIIILHIVHFNKHLLHIISLQITHFIEHVNEHIAEKQSLHVVTLKLMLHKVHLGKQSVHDNICLCLHV